MRPTRRALVLLAVLLPLALLPALVDPRLAGVWLGGTAALLAAVGADLLLARRPSRLALELDVPALVAVGTGGELALEVSLPGGREGRPVPVRLGLDLPDLLAPVEPRTVEVGEAPAAVRFPLRPLRRGRGRIEAVWAAWEGPLGLVRWSVRRPVEGVHGRVRVVPDVRALGRALSALDLREAREGSKVVRFAGEGSEFEALAEYVPGLDPRHIDWKASARHTQLLVRETRAERNHRVVLAVDTGRLMAEPVGGVPLLDHALHAALLLARVSLATGDRVSLFPFADRPGMLTAPRGGLGAFPHLLAVAGKVGYSTAETNYTLCLTHLQAKLGRRSLVVVFTDFVDSVTAGLMVDNLLRLGRRHLILFVAIRDPLLDELVAARPEELADVDRALVAASLAKDREEVLLRLARQGVLAVDAPPEALRPRLVDRYLEVVRRELV